MPSTLLTEIIRLINDMDYTIDDCIITDLIWANEPIRWEWYLDTDTYTIALWVLAEINFLQLNSKVSFHR